MVDGAVGEIGCPPSAHRLTLFEPNSAHFAAWCLIQGQILHENR